MFRIVTYNTHRWVGIDRKISYKRIADVLASTGSSIIALQEARIGRISKGEPNQLEMLARILSMELHFQPTIKVFDEQYGLAILTKNSSKIVKAEYLPSIAVGAGMEKRSALWVEVQEGKHNIQVINTHLSLRATNRNLQAKSLLSEEWVSSAQKQGPVILLGDFNAPTRSKAYKLIKEDMSDVQLAESVDKARPTFHVRMPFMRLDHIFLKGDMEVLRAGPWVTPISKIASDHLPLVADISLSGEQ